MIVNTITTVKPGISITVTFPSTIPVPAFGEAITFSITDDLTSAVGNEQVVLVFGTTSIALVDELDRLYVTRQMLRQPRLHNGRMVGGLYRVQMGVNGTTPSIPTFITRRGFNRRRTLINTVAVQTP